LYRESDLLIVDEGTSALDLKTQSEIINQLNSLKNRPAIIMVAHRMEILDGYDEIYEFNNGSLKKILG
jgi:ABC-type transport system involved in cytochrome bd biosynthesis fused ATPase/permease subunit